MTPLDHVILFFLGVAQLAIYFAIVTRRRRDWRMFVPFLRHDTLPSLQQKIFSFEEALNAKVITDQNGVISSINLAAEDLLGYRQNEVIGKSLEMFLAPADRPKLKEQLERELTRNTEIKTGYTSLIDKAGNSVAVEIVVRKKKVEDIVCYLVIFRDRRKEEADARRNEQAMDILKIKLNILSKGEEIGNTGSWLWDVSTGEITASENYKKIIGLEQRGKYRIEEIKPRVWDEDKEVVNAALDRAFAGLDYEIRFRMIRANDLRVIHIQSNVQVIKDANGVVVALYGFTQLLKIVSIKDASLTPPP